LADSAATASRWAGLDRTRAGLVAFILLVSLIAGIWGATRMQGQGPASLTVAHAPPAPKANADLALYNDIIERMAAGENYYVAAAEELRRGDYPLKPVFAFRLPTLAVAAAWLGRPIMMGLQYALFLAMIWAWWARLDGQFADDGRRISATMLAAAGLAVAFSGRYLILHEVWAGALVALSLALHRPGRAGWSIATAALALAIRELALPYLLLMGAFALYRRNWREAAGWGGVILLFAFAMTWHANEVANVVLPSDPGSPGWSVFGGWAGFLRTYYLAGPLRWLPAEAAAPLIILALFGWASWKSGTGLAATLLYSGYALAFMLFGRANNFYWGLMVAPAFLIGLAFVPRAFSDLRSALVAREAAE
jgi:hypothetical protein